MHTSAPYSDKRSLRGPLQHWVTALCILGLGCADDAPVARDDGRPPSADVLTSTASLEEDGDDTSATAPPPAADALVSSRNASAIVGGLLFFGGFPDARGDGRVCATCHVAADSFQLTPAHVEARYQALQLRKRRDSHADDPLFRAIDADDNAEDFALLRQHALVRVVIPLPTDASGNKLVWPVDDPTATSVQLFRATPSILNVALSAPYQYDGRFATLQLQAAGALTAHAEVKGATNPRFLDDIAAFQSTRFSSVGVALLADALRRGVALPSLEPELTPLEQRGKAIFARVCGNCHGGPRMDTPLPELAAVVGLRDIGISRPVPPFATDLPFAPSPLQNKVRVWAVRVPGQEPIVRPSTDPGEVLLTGKIEDFNSFDIPSLFGIAKTAPYFRDNSAATLRDLVRHYQLLNEAVQRVVPPEAPFPVRPDTILDSDFDPLVAYLETL
jgi:cytochrome c peroxidase